MATDSGWSTQNRSTPNSDPPSKPPYDTMMYFSGTPSITARASTKLVFSTTTKSVGDSLEIAPSSSAFASAVGNSTATEPLIFQPNTQATLASTSELHVQTTDPAITQISTVSISPPPFDPAPASMPMKLSLSATSSSSDSITLPNLRHTVSSLPTPSTSTTEYKYDMSLSNIILPRGSIRRTADKSIESTIPRSSSTPTSLKLPASRSAPAPSNPATGSVKIEKGRKPKKMNSTSLYTTSMPSSVVSVPAADGEAETADPIPTERWPDALYQGWMKKRNKGKESTAKMRYLVVKTNCIEYYSDPASEKPKGTIRFDEIAVQFNNSLRVYVREKVWEFQAESERDLTRWHVVWRAVLCSINK